MRKIYFLLVLITLAQLPATAQFIARNAKNRGPIVIDESIRNVYVTDNIDVLLIEDRPERSGVKVSSTSVEKLQVRVDGDNLFLSSARNVDPDDRIHVFVTVSDLNKIELRGDSYVTTRGVLHTRNLSVILKENARAAIRSKGEVLVSTPANYRIIKNKDYYSVYAVSSL